jgi:hypothetical protein
VRGRTLWAWLVGVLMLLAAAGARAEDDDVTQAMRAIEAAQQRSAPRAPVDTAKSAPGPAPAPAVKLEQPGEAPREGGEGQLAVFVLQRGFYFSSDVGVFMSFGGTNGYSNIQPYLAVKAGFDVNQSLSVQLAMAHGYVSENPISSFDTADGGGQHTSSFGLIAISGEASYAFRPTPRFAIEPRLGAGVTHIYPALTDPSDARVTLSSINPHVTGGADFKYLTLLTDFSAGASLTGYFIIGPNIPAAALALVVHYTF